MSDTALDRFLQYGTNAERLAFTPDPPLVGTVAVPVLYIWRVSDDGSVYVYDTTWNQIVAGSSLNSTFYVVATTTEQVTNTTMQDDNELFFNVVANGVYAYDLFLLVNTGTTAGVDCKVGITIPSGTVTNWNLGYLSGANGVNSTFADVNFFSCGAQNSSVGPLTRGALSTTVFSAGTPFISKGIIRVGATAGTTQVQFAQATASTTFPLTRQADSWISYTRIS